MAQDYLDFNTGDNIGFVLTVFSTVLAIVTMIESPSNDHSSDEISRLKAEYHIMNSSNNGDTEPNQLLSAYNTLHDPDHVIYFYKYSNESDPTNKIMMAIAYYNKGGGSQYK